MEILKVACEVDIRRGQIRSIVVGLSRSVLVGVVAIHKVVSVGCLRILLIGHLVRFR